MEALSSLPRRPMALSELKALDEREGFEQAQPVLVADDGGEPLAVGVLLVASKTAVGAGYDLEERRWLKVSTRSIASLGSDRARSEAMAELADWSPAGDADAAVYMMGEPTFGPDDDLSDEYRDQYDLRESTAGG